MEDATRSLLDTLLQSGRERRAEYLRGQPPGLCDNIEHDHPDGPPQRLLFATYWLCPHDEVLAPDGRAGGQRWARIGDLTTEQRRKLERKSGLR